MLANKDFSPNDNQQPNTKGILHLENLGNCFPTLLLLKIRKRLCLGWTLLDILGQDFMYMNGVLEGSTPYIPQATTDSTNYHAQIVTFLSFWGEMCRLTAYLRNDD